MRTLNLDLILPYNTMNRMLFELYRSQSANVNFVSDPDKVRAKQYISALRTQVDYISTNPGYLDLPKTNPMEFPLKDIVADQEIENDAYSHLCQILKVGMIELIESSSSRFSGGLAPADKVRILAVLAKMEKHFTDYIAQAMPLDYSESSPQAPINGPGYTGINA